MVKSCCAYACSNEWKPNGEVIFHRFPLKRPDMLTLWIQAVRLVNFYPNINTVICSEHFKNQDYIESSLTRKLLKKDSVPSVFKIPGRLQKKPIAERREIIRYAGPSIIPKEALPFDVKVEISDTVDTATQTSPSPFKNSSEELKMRRQIKILQQKLLRRDSKIMNMKHLIQYLKESNQCSSNLEFCWKYRKLNKKLKNTE